MRSPDRARRLDSWRTNTTTQDLHYADDETHPNLGDGYHRSWEQQGAGSFARVVVDDSEPVRHDGSLRLATRVEGDRLALQRLTSPDGGPGPALAEFTGGYALRVKSGPPAPYTMDAVCPPTAERGTVRFTLRYAGPYPAGRPTPSADRCRSTPLTCRTRSSAATVSTRRGGPRSTSWAERTR